MAEPSRKDHRIYTYRDYLSWPDDERWEILGGKAYSMSPGPFEEHQRVSIELSAEFALYLRGKPCRAYEAPFDVILPEPGETSENASNVVQPDIFIVCDRDKIKRKGCIGPPDLIVEILSTSTASNDMKYKFKLYERSGVKEYWIVDPVHKTVMVFISGEDKFFGKPGIYSSEDKIKVTIFSDLEIDLKVIFA